MNVIFANNQAMSAIFGTDSVITTDPVAMGGNDRAAVTFSVHYAFATNGTPQVSYEAEISNDGQNWTTDSTAPLTDSATAATGTTPKYKESSGVNAAYIRFKYTLTWNAGGSAGDIAGVCFDLHVKLDHE